MKCNILFFHRPKFTNDFQTTNGNNKSNGNNFKECLKSRTHLGFGGDGKYIYNSFFFFNSLYFV